MVELIYEQKNQAKPGYLKNLMKILRLKWREVKKPERLKFTFI